MPKLRSHSGAKKRARLTGSGKLALKRGRRNHLLMQKNRRQKRLARVLLIAGGDVKRTLALLPNI